MLFALSPKVSEVLEAWLTVQRNWLYLQPIFESPDINKQVFLMKDYPTSRGGSYAFPLGESPPECTPFSESFPTICAHEIRSI